MGSQEGRVQLGGVQKEEVGKEVIKQKYGSFLNFLWLPWSLKSEPFNRTGRMVAGTPYHPEGHAVTSFHA